MPVLLAVSLAGLVSARAGAVTLKQRGPYGCGGRNSTECELQFVGRAFGGFDAEEAPAESVAVSMVGVTTASQYEAMIRRVQRLQREGRPIVLEPAGETEPQSSFALATLLLFDEGESSHGTRSYVDEGLFPYFGGWYSNPEYSAQGVRLAGGVWARSFSTAWAVVAIPGTPARTVTLPYRVRRANSQERFTSFTIQGGEGVVLYCEPEQTPERADCPGYYGPEAERSPQPRNPWPFL
jgi:hypothetical protein